MPEVAAVAAVAKDVSVRRMRLGELVERAGLGRRSEAWPEVVITDV
jgi:hypothetical protein